MTSKKGKEAEKSGQMVVEDDSSKKQVTHGTGQSGIRRRVKNKMIILCLLKEMLL
jgi:hypothetical protein